MDRSGFTHRSCLEAHIAKGHKKKYWAIFFLTENELMWFIQLQFAAALPIHRKVILKQHRNSVTAYKLSAVSQKWQLRARYHVSLALLLTHHSSVASYLGLPLPLNFRGFRSKSLSLRKKLTRPRGAKDLNLALRMKEQCTLLCGHHTRVQLLRYYFLP
jgi:hypothetical protein